MRVERSFAFLDLCGFTSLTSTEGDEKATSVLADFRASLRDIASRRGVRVAKWLGDGAMVVGVESEPLVSAVLEVEQRVDGGSSPLPIRAGMARGRVILFEGDDYIGSPVNLAARLCDVAGPRQVLAVPELADTAPAWAERSEVRKVRVLGFAEHIELVRLSLRPGGPGAVLDPVCGLTIPADAVYAIDPDEATGPGAPTRFCSVSCAAAWRDRHPPEAVAAGV